MRLSDVGKVIRLEYEPLPFPEADTGMRALGRTLAETHIRMREEIKLAYTLIEQDPRSSLIEE